MAYDAFISYSHAVDGRLAPALQAGLQQLAKPWNRRRALDIFRDETGLSTNPHLWSSIESALDSSAWFVLLASPEAAASDWVNREICRWVATKPVDRILSVVTDGDWSWDAGTHALRGDAVPEALRAALEDEPRHLDLRWGRSVPDLDLRNSRFRAAVADLAAPMHGISKDELEGEDIRQHRRARRLARTAVGALALLLSVSVAFGVLALKQRDESRHNADVATQRQRSAIASNVATAALTHAGNVDLSLLLATAAHRLHDAPDTRGTLSGALAAASHLSRIDYVPGDPIIASSSSRGGTDVALARADGRVEVWRTDPWRRVTAVDTGAPITGVALSPDGRLVAVQTRSNIVQLRRMPRGQLVQRFPAAGFLEGAWSAGAALAFSPDSRRLAFVDNGGIAIIDTETGTRDGVFVDGIVKTLAFAGDATHLVAGTVLDGAVLLSVTPAAPFAVTQTSSTAIDVDLVSSFATRPGDSDLIAFGSISGDVGVYSRSAHRTLWQVRSAHSGAVHAVAFDPARRLVMSTGDDGRVLLWDRANGARWGELGGVGGVEVTSFFLGNRGASATGALGAGDAVVTVSPNGVATWRLDALAIGSRYALARTSHCETPNSGLVSAGAVLVSFADCAYIWDGTGRGARVRPLVPAGVTGTEFSFVDAAVARGGVLAMLATGVGITIFDARTGARERTIVKGVRDLADARIALRPDGLEVAVAGPVGPPNTDFVSSTVRAQIRTFDVATGALIKSTTLPGHIVDALTYAPDGHTIAVGNDDGTVDLYAPETGAVTSMQGNAPAREIDAIAFAPNGRWLAAASGDGTVRIVDVPGGRERASWINPRSGPLGRIAIAPDGRTLAVMSWTGELSRWAMPSGEEIGGALAIEPEGTSSVPDLVEAALPSVIFVDADRVATSSLDNSVTIWDFRPAALARTACRFAGRDLTPTEWALYMSPLPYAHTCG